MSDDVRVIALAYVEALRAGVAATDAAAIAQKCEVDEETIEADKAHTLRACETVINLIRLEF